ncbi:TPA: hypothetical protein DDX30_03170 [Candidatus Wolfebacteria bacterium]|nr:hypothetical protein [Candidatus Wolfebacteria bacterium]
MKPMSKDKNLQAYVIGLAIGDGNLSKFPRTTRLRITCDDKYPNLMHKICEALQKLFPTNKISLSHQPKHCTDVICYSNSWEDILGWSSTKGSKTKQCIRVPQWIKNDTEYTKQCLKGLFETDGSVYMDRTYLMANFTTALEGLAIDTMEMATLLGYKPNIQKNTRDDRTKYTVRISKRTQEFVDLIDLHKN